MTFDDLIRYKALRMKYVSDNQGLLDYVINNGTEMPANIPMKNVCAMITQELFDELTNTCSLLDISKRTFIESAIIEALTKAQNIMEAEGLEQYLATRSKIQQDA